MICPPSDPAPTVDFVDGRTRLYAILGHPIVQVRSPQAITHELRRRGHNAIMLPFDVAPADFDGVFSRLAGIANLDGLIITIPHKVRVRELVDKVGPLAQISGSASVIARTSDEKWVGELFEGMGCVAAIRNRGVTFAGKRVLLLGAGGAGSGIAAEIARQAPATINIDDPDGNKSERLIARIAPLFPATHLAVGRLRLDEIDILINASPVGMLDATQTPVEMRRFPPQLVVADAITEPAPTRLLRTAEESGCLAIYGREMFDSQIVAACDFLLNTRTKPSREVSFESEPPPVY